MPNRMQLVAPVAVMLTRLRDACNAGKLLSGLTFKNDGFGIKYGKTDLPFIVPTVLRAEDSLFAGAPYRAPGWSVGDQMARDVANQQQKQTLQLSLACDREKGLYDLDNTNQPRNRGLLEWWTLVRTVICRAEDGLPDMRLGGSCSRPLEIALIENGIDEVAWSFIIRVTMWPMQFVPGTENDLLAVQL